MSYSQEAHKALRNFRTLAIFFSSPFPLPSVCALSALTPSCVSGTELRAWDSEVYFTVMVRGRVEVVQEDGQLEDANTQEWWVRPREQAGEPCYPRVSWNCPGWDGRWLVRNGNWMMSASLVFCGDSSSSRPCRASPPCFCLLYSKDGVWVRLAAG